MRIPTNITPSMEKEKQEREKMIADLPMRDRMITDQEFYRQKLAEKKEEYHGSEDTIRRMFHAFWANNMTGYALYPRYDERGSGGKNSTLKQADLDAMAEIYDTYVLSREEPDKEKAYSRLLNEYYIIEDWDPEKDMPGDTTSIYREDRPTKRQFSLYWDKRKKEDPDEFYQRRKGKKRYRLESRPVMGKSDYLSYGPGDCYFIDGTVMDCYAVDAFNRAIPLGRPTIYLGIDGMSHVLPGCFVTLRSESWEGYSMLLYYSFTGKKHFCEKYGIQIQEEDWPVHGLPGTIYADNSSMKCIQSGLLTQDLWISVENLEPARGDLKGLVENLFSQINDFVIASAPGRVTLEESGKYVERAALTLDEIMQLVIDFCLTHNKAATVDHTLLPDEVQDQPDPNPLSLWNWGMTNRTGGLREVSEDLLKVALLPAGKAEIKANGLKFGNHFYTNQDALKKGWFTLAREERGKGFIRVHTDEKAKRIYYMDPDKREFITFTMVEHEQYVSGDLTWEEDEIVQKRMEEGKKKQDQRYETAIHRLRKRCDTIYKKAKRKRRRDVSRMGDSKGWDRERSVENYLEKEKETISTVLNPGGGRVG